MSAANGADVAPTTGGGTQEPAEGTLNLRLRVWRQDGPDEPGRFENYDADGISPDASFLEMLDIVNERLTLDGREPIVFESDCREGICGTCGLMINGRAHGPQKGTATCQLHMRRFADGDRITIEPWRAGAFELIRDLAVDRTPLDGIIAAGGVIRQLTPEQRQIWVETMKPVWDQFQDDIGADVIAAAVDSNS